MQGEALVDNRSTDGIHSNGNQAGNNQRLVSQARDKLEISLDVIQGEVGFVLVQRNDRMEGENLRYCHQRIHKRDEKMSGSVIPIKTAIFSVCGSRTQIGDERIERIQLLQCV